MIKLYLAQKDLMDTDYEATRVTLDEIINIFKEKEIFTRVVECEMLKAEMLIVEDKNVDEFRKAYNKVLDMAKAHAMEMRGPVIAESSWRVGKEMAEIGMNKDDR